ncbi:MAG: single-stranded DNA-binding protein [Nocardiopsaceae bacterium]|nr:single-stranded DNA-binding protein [Nocardiopsaceae bacterium]
MYEAHVNMTGFVVTQPTMLVVGSGITKVWMRVAWTPRYFDRASSEWTDGDTSYATVICWRKLATNAAVSLRTGDPVSIQGRLSVRDFQDKEGRPRTAVEIDATSLGHDLTRGIANFQRLRPQTGKTAAEHAAAQEEAGEAGASDEGGSANGMPVADEPGRSIFNESAISEDADSEEAAAAA